MLTVTPSGIVFKLASLQCLKTADHTFDACPRESRFLDQPGVFIDKVLVFGLERMILQLQVLADRDQLVYSAFEVPDFV